MNLSDINKMSAAEFVHAFGDIAEHSQWVAEVALHKRPFHSREDMILSFNAALLASIDDAKLALIRAHPDLAGRAKLSDDSKSEQKGAGLDTLSPEEFARFNHLNELYKTTFGFPFIFAVKGATKHKILESFEKRVTSSRADEFAVAIEMITRIMRFRLEDRVLA